MIAFSLRRRLWSCCCGPAMTIESDLLRWYHPHRERPSSFGLDEAERNPQCCRLIFFKDFDVFLRLVGIVAPVTVSITIIAIIFIIIVIKVYSESCTIDCVLISEILYFGIFVRHCRIPIIVVYRPHGVWYPLYVLISRQFGFTRRKCDCKETHALTQRATKERKKG